MLIGQSDKLELFHWFVRAHLEDKGGNVASSGASTEKAAAGKVAARTAKRTKRRRLAEAERQAGSGPRTSVR